MENDVMVQMAEACLGLETALSGWKEAGNCFSLDEVYVGSTDVAPAFRKSDSSPECGMMLFVYSQKLTLACCRTS